MSSPARSVAPALPDRVVRRPAPARGRPVRRTPTPHARPASGQAATPDATARARASRRTVRPAFWALAAVVLTTIVVGLVSVSALVVETGFGIDRAEARIAKLVDEGERLRRDVAATSAPGHVARWAKRRGLVMPEEVIVLQVPGGGADRASE